MTMGEMLALLGGVGLFLYGMSLLSHGVREAAGERLRGFLKRTTGHPPAAVAVGTLVTVLVQSASATEIMAMGFLDAGLMDLRQAAGVIMGANIGTTVTAQLTACDLSALAPLAVFAGCVLRLFFKRPAWRHVGGMALGLGLLFMGIGQIRGALSPLSGRPSFLRLLSALSRPGAAILFGALFTALLQSSSSSVVIFQAFAAQGLLTLEQCAYLVIGAAVGAVTPTLLASLTAERPGRQAARLNLYFNLLRVALLTLAVSLFPGLLSLIRRLSPGDAARQVANAHTLFALAAVAVLLPFSGTLTRLARRGLSLPRLEKSPSPSRRR